MDKDNEFVIPLSAHKIGFYREMKPRFALVSLSQCIFSKYIYCIINKPNHPALTKSSKNIQQTGIIV